MPPARWRREGSTSYSEIVDCAAAYSEALREAGHGDEARMASDVLGARVRLADCLMRAGWTPSEDILIELMRDGELLGLALGSFERDQVLHQHI